MSACRQIEEAESNIDSNKLVTFCDLIGGKYEVESLVSKRLLTYLKDPVVGEISLLWLNL